MKRVVPVNPLVLWAVRREELRRNKAAGGPPPWSSDPILTKYRFTNVRRRDDRVSQWLIQSVLTEANLDAAGLSSFLMFAAFCRWNNWPPTLREIMARGLWPTPRVDWQAIGAVVDELKAAKQKAWTGAYIITAKKIGSRPKGQFIAQVVVRDAMEPALLHIEQALRSKVRRNVWVVLKELPSWGTFMAGQVVDDLGFTPLLSGAHDYCTWAPQGPGSVRGANRVLNLPLNTRHSEEAWCAQLQVWRREIETALGFTYGSLGLHDVQNVCCEYSKYAKVQLGEGKPRSNYKPETAY